MAHTLSTAQTAGIANIVEWAKLALSSPTARVLRVTRIVFDDNDRPIALEEAVLPLDRFPGLIADGGDIPDIIELGKRHGVSVARASERISIVSATKKSRRIWGSHPDRTCSNSTGLSRLSTASQ